MLSASHRLRSSTDIRATFKGGRAGSTFFVVCTRYEPGLVHTGGPHLAVVVSKKVGNSVVRHTQARRLRHLFRPLLHDLQPDLNLVIRAQPAIVDASWEELQSAAQHCLSKALSKRQTGSSSFPGEEILRDTPAKKDTPVKVENSVEDSDDY